MPASASEPPPSQAIPTKSGSGPYLVGIVVLLGLAIGLVVWKRGSGQNTTPQAASVSVAVAPPPPPPPQFQYAPPPPPKIEEEPDAGAPEPPKPIAKGTAAPAATATGPCSGKCDGQSSPALNSALRATAQSAQGCYNRALRNSEVSGTMTVAVQVGPSGSVCSASLANDTVHSNEIASCVLGRFRGKSFPPPQGGCSTLQIPITFSIRQ